MQQLLAARLQRISRWQ